MSTRRQAEKPHPSAAPPALAAPRLLAHVRAMRAVQAVARHGSTARAAEAMHLSQPAVARAVLELEKACDVALFVRGARGMNPTAPGALLCARIDMFFSHLVSGATEAIAAEPVASRRMSSPDRFPAVITSGQLRAVLAIAQAGTEGAAAALLGVTQPAVHAALRDLEQQLKVRLFFKLAFGTRLTPAGEALLRRVKLAMSELAAMDRDISSWRGEMRGKVVIGILPLSTPIFLPGAVAALQARHPELEVQIIDGTYESMMQQLLSADVDAIAGALRKNVDTDEVKQHHLFTDELVVIARAGHPCFDHPALTLEDLLQWGWSTPLPDTPADRALERVFRDAGLEPPRRQLRASSQSMTQSLVMQGDLLAIGSRGEIQVNDCGGRLKVVPVALPSTRRSIGIATRAMGQPTQDIQLLIEACRDASAALAGILGDLCKTSRDVAGPPSEVEHDTR